MEIVIDYREKSLIDKINTLLPKYENLKVITENLDIGDIIIRFENKIIIIFERKTLNDLLSSIKDGRYREQSLRLSASQIENHNIIYLIEGQTTFLGDNKRIVQSAIFSLNYYKGFSVYRSENITDTASTILNIGSKLLKEKDKQPYYPKSNERKEDDYISTIKKKKSDNINKDNFLDIILCQIPSISEITAKAISSEYKTVDNLINKLKENKDCLNDLKYMTAKNQERKISKTSISNIINFLIN